MPKNITREDILLLTLSLLAFAVALATMAGEW